MGLRVVTIEQISYTARFKAKAQQPTTGFAQVGLMNMAIQHL
jgi:hypothetical protein